MATTPPETPARAPRLPYMPGVDGLRTLAVGSVVAYHAGATWLPGGFLGVDVFLVISGYLITSLLLAERRSTGRIDLVRFWLRRARRLLPAVFVMMAIVLAWMVVFHHDEVGRLRGAVVASVFYVVNWYQVVADVSYFEQFARPSVFLHLWSLAVEEQFYLIWPPLLALLIMRLGPRRVFYVVVAGIIASTVLAWVLFEPFVDPSRIYYGTDTRAGGLLVGVALAFLWPASRLGRAGESAKRPLLDALGFAALVALIGIMCWMGEFDSSLYQGGFLLVAVVTAVVLAVVAHPRSLLGKGFAWVPLVWLGKRSYSIYLWHWPVLMLSRGDQDVPFDGPVLVVLQLALTLGLACASYRFVEEPFRKHGFAGIVAWLKMPGRDGRRHRMAGAATAVATVVVALFVALLPATTPTIEGIPPASAVITPGTPRPDVSGTPNPTTGGPARDGDPAKPARKPVKGPVLAVGDSVMVGAAPALRGVLGTRVQIDAAVARQFDVAASATLDDLPLVKPKAVVLHLGTNGYVPFEGLEALLDDLKDLPVVLVTVRVDKPWEGSVNDALRYAAERRKNVVLADWHAATDGRGDLLVDGVHANTEGQELYAETIMAALRRAVNLPAS